MRASVIVSTLLVASSRIRIRGIGQHRAGEADRLPLAERKAAAAFADLRLEAIRAAPRSDRRQSSRSAASITSASVASGRPTRMLSSTVPLNRKLCCSTMPICRCSESPRICRISSPSIEQLAGGRQIELRDQIDDRRLAAAGVADQGNRLARASREIDVVQHQPSRIVAERQIRGTRLARGSVRVPSAVSGSVQSAGVSSSVNTRSAPAIAVRAWLY